MGERTCPHSSMYWYPAPHNERGWKCADCGFQPGEEPGYSPQHDRDLIETKCWCILHDMADAQLVSVSNGGHGDSLAHSAARIARDQRTFDQESIVAILANLCAGDGEFWRNQHEQILAGNDPRHRCHCGKIAHISCGGKHYCSFACEPRRPQRNAGRWEVSRRAKVIRFPPGSLDWLAHGERGTSSETIFATMTGVPVGKYARGSHPYDPADFRRCRELLAAVPEFKRRLKEMRRVSHAWRVLVEHWDELCALMDDDATKTPDRAPQTYARMLELLNA